MLLIYSDIISARLEYTLDFMFHSACFISYKLTNSKADFDQHDGPKITYADESTTDRPGMHILPSGLLAKKGTNPVQVNSGSWNDVTTLFPNEGKSVPFDIFSAVFYLISRYEEYDPNNTLDQFGRYKATNSILFKLKLLETPIVNNWIEKLCEYLEKEYPGLNVEKPGYTFNFTLDLDHAYAYKGKNLLHKFGGYVKDIFRIPAKYFFQRSLDLLGWKKDPYNTYRYLIRQAANADRKLLFVLLSNNRSELDKNLPVNHPLFKPLIHRLRKEFELGIHPSYFSNDSKEELTLEFDHFELLTGEKPTISRQHYLKLNIPRTCKEVLDMGIREEFTMGYPEHIGFRAGTCTLFSYYDFENETPTKMIFYPMNIMDGSLKNYMKLSPEEAIQRSALLINQIKRYGGTFTLLWHNSSFCTYYGWGEWKQVFETIIKEATA